MRHGNSEKQLGRDTNHRKALIKNLLCSLFNHERIETTVIKAKELQPVSEKMISLGIEGSLHSRRMAFAFMNNRTVVDKLFNDIAKRYENPQGGYTRIIKTRQRKGDGAVMAVLELTKYKAPEKKEEPAKETEEGKVAEA